MIRFIAQKDKKMANGMRDMSRTPLMEKKTSHTVSPQSNMLAKKAKKEIRLTGMTTVLCPMCGEAPQVTTTSKGERTIVSCKCGYVYDAEINF